MRRAQTRDPLPSAKLRRDRLRRLADFVDDRRTEICAAVDDDFGGRAAGESLALEICPLLASIGHARRRVATWMAGENRTPAWFSLPARAEIVLRPLGIVGIIAPWNYPLLLCLSPAVSAMAAGNRVVIKPSEFSPALTQLLCDGLGRRFDSDELQILPDDGQLGPQFAAAEFDHIFFTGSPGTGRKVLSAAAQSLTRTTLELGGRCPAILAPEAKIEAHAELILRAKLINAGQSCVAPNHLFVPSDQLDRSIAALQSAALRLYPEWWRDSEYSALATPPQRAKLTEMVEEAEDLGARIIELGQTPPSEPQSVKFRPRLALDLPNPCRLHTEEIFGPVLPIYTYDARDPQPFFQTLAAPPHPLAALVFGAGRASKRRLGAAIRSGTVSFDGPLIHFAQDDLPMGGLGRSGIGQYHGYEGFLRFSHQRADYHQYRPNAVEFCLPPHRVPAQRQLLGLLRRLLRSL